MTGLKYFLVLGCLGLSLGLDMDIVMNRYWTIDTSTKSLVKSTYTLNPIWDFDFEDLEESWPWSGNSSMSKSKVPDIVLKTNIMYLEALFQNCPNTISVDQIIRSYTLGLQISHVLNQGQSQNKTSLTPDQKDMAFLILRNIVQIIPECFQDLESEPIHIQACPGMSGIVNELIDFEYDMNLALHENIHGFHEKDGKDLDWDKDLVAQFQDKIQKINEKGYEILTNDSNFLFNHVNTTHLKYNTVNLKNFLKVKDTELLTCNIQTPVLDSLENFWIDFQNNYESMVSNIYETYKLYEKNKKIDDYSSHKIWENPETKFEFQTERLQVRLENFFQKTKALDSWNDQDTTHQRESLMSLVFEGLGHAGMTGMIASGSGIGTAISGFVSLIGYAGQTGTLLNQIYNSPQIPKLSKSEILRHEYLEYVKETGQRICGSPEKFRNGLLLRLGNTFEDNRIGWADSSQSVLVIPSGPGIVYEDHPQVACFETNLRSDTIDIRTFARYLGKTGHQHVWELTNLQELFHIHDTINLGCGKDMTLLIKKEDYTGLKSWKIGNLSPFEIPYGQDLHDVCNKFPLKRINYEFEGCSLNPSERLRGYYTCEQLFSTGIINHTEVFTITDLTFQETQKVFVQEKYLTWVFDPVSNSEHRHLCGRHSHGKKCVWPQRLWPLRDSGRVYEVLMGGSVDEFEFECPVGMALRPSLHGKVDYVMTGQKVLVQNNPKKESSVPVSYGEFQCYNSKSMTNTFRVIYGQSQNAISRLQEEKNNEFKSILYRNITKFMFSPNQAQDWEIHDRYIRVNPWWKPEVWVNLGSSRDSLPYLNLRVGDCQGPFFDTTMYNGLLGQNIRDHDFKANIKFIKSKVTQEITCKIDFEQPHVLIKCSNVPKDESICLEFIPSPEICIEPDQNEIVRYNKEEFNIITNQNNFFPGVMDYVPNGWNQEYLNYYKEGQAGKDMILILLKRNDPTILASGHTKDTASFSHTGRTFCIGEKSKDPRKIIYYDLAFQTMITPKIFPIFRPETVNVSSSLYQKYRELSNLMDLGLSNYSQILQVIKNHKNLPNRVMVMAHDIVQDHDNAQGRLFDHQEKIKEKIMNIWNELLEEINIGTMDSDSDIVCCVLDPLTKTMYKYWDPKNTWSCHGLFMKYDNEYCDIKDLGNCKDSSKLVSCGLKDQETWPRELITNYGVLKNLTNSYIRIIRMRHRLEQTLSFYMDTSIEDLSRPFESDKDLNLIKVNNLDINTSNNESCSRVPDYILAIIGLMAIVIILLITLMIYFIYKVSMNKS